MVFTKKPWKDSWRRIPSTALWGVIVTKAIRCMEASFRKDVGVEDLKDDLDDIKVYCDFLLVKLEEEKEYVSNHTSE